MVAPGIAEALLATGLGLLAAIPAVIFYNKLTQDTETLDRRLRELRRRVLDDPVAPARPGGGLRWACRCRAAAAPGAAGTRRRRPMAEINVTPMVDVMLVLLIIFMVAAPLLTVGVPIELPKTAATPLPTEQEEPLTIALTADGQILVQNAGGRARAS